MMTRLSNQFRITAALMATCALVACNRQTDTQQAENSQSQAATTRPAITTAGNQVDDTVVTAKVKTALVADPNIKGLDIKVETSKGDVLLSGFVDSQQQIDRGVALAKRVEGVKNVDSRLTVKDANATLGNQIDDSLVTAKIKSALLADSTVKGLDISVVTYRGNVQLSGFVDSDMQRVHATELAKSVSGVVKVTDEINIKR